MKCSKCTHRFNCFYYQYCGDDTPIPCVDGIEGELDSVNTNLIRYPVSNAQEEASAEARYFNNIFK